MCKNLKFRLGQWNPTVTSSQELFTAAFTLFELIAMEEKTQIAGITIVLDVSGFGFQHLKSVEMSQSANFEQLENVKVPWNQRIEMSL